MPDLLLLYDGAYLLLDNDSYLIIADGIVAPSHGQSPRDRHDYLGRYQLGDSVIIPLVTSDSQDIPFPPDFMPTARIVPVGPGAAGQVWEVPVLPLDPPDVFLGSFVLTSRLSPYPAVPIGRYTVRIDYSIDSVKYVRTATFDVTTGGDASGGVISLKETRRPPGSAVVAQLSSGVLVSGRNPRVT